MAETVSRDVDVVKDKLLSSSVYKYQEQNVAGNTPYVKLPACWTEQNKDTTTTQTKLLSKQLFVGKFLAFCFSLRVNIPLIETSEHGLEAKFFPLGLSLRGSPACSLAHTVTSLLYGKPLIRKIQTSETGNALQHKCDRYPVEQTAQREFQGSWKKMTMSVGIQESSCNRIKHLWYIPMSLSKLMPAFRTNSTTSSMIA